MMRRDRLVSSIVGEGAAAWTAWRALPHPERVRLRAWAVWIALVTLVFLRPLANLMVYASGVPLHSHIPLVPFIAAYLLSTRRTTLPPAAGSSFVGTIVMAAISVAALASSFVWSERLTLNDALALKAFAYVGAVTAGGFLFVGSRWMAAAAFPVAFLIFMVPLPDAAVRFLEVASVHASADVSAWFFRITGTPMLRDGVIFKLPTIVIEVARECSGIRSSWVLLITSLVASNMFLTSTWRRLLLVALVIPLGIVRNGFRILVIGLLCVYIGPHMIDSIIHHRGGPIFFVVSLIPLFLVAVWLRRSERTS
jgi:exosortase C (VPDSG-CTERM-specific)